MYEMIFWGVLFVVLIIAESFTLHLVSIWFAVGSAAAFIASIFHAPLIVQVILFIAISILLLIFTRPIVQKAKATHKPTNADAIIGKNGVVIETIDNLHNLGRIQIEGLSWNSRSTENILIEKGTIVRIEHIEGVTVFVSPINHSN